MAPKKYQHLSDQEIADMDRDFKNGIAPENVHARLRHARAKKGGKGPSLHSVYRFASGATHKRGKADGRGKEALLSQQDVRTLDRARRVHLYPEGG